ncbi:putative cytochrome P450 [Xylaria digitata]|nr:putative cytochrome P450 [Xylaria digitata]
MPQLGVDFKATLGGLFGSVILYHVCIIIYRIFFSNVAKFPGPKLAAATSWYEAFFDLRSSNFPDVLERLHDKYANSSGGPIIRINPWELSIRDAEFYNEVYVPAGKWRTELISKNRAGLGISDAISTTSSHKLHQLRRKAVENFFSRQNVTRMEARIHEEARSLDEKLRLLAGTRALVHLDHAFDCAARDLAALHESVMGILAMVPYLRGLPWINSVLKLVPMSLLQKPNPRAAGFQMFHVLSKRRIEEVKSDLSSKTKLEESNKTSIFRHILQSNLPESEKDSARLQREEFVLLAAGTITTSSTLSIITYYVLADPAIENQLREDLKYVTSGFPQRVLHWTGLEKIPYLMACIKEGLRRSPRISPDCDIQYKQWTILKNTPVGMSVCHLHMDPEVYPEPYKFIPERWIGDVDSLVNRNCVPFLKGSRNCLGMNLAWAEMYIVLGLLFRPGGHRMSLDCDESDIVLIRDSDVGIPKPDSRGLRVRFE